MVGTFDFNGFTILGHIEMLSFIFEKHDFVSANGISFSFLYIDVISELKIFNKRKERKNIEMPFIMHQSLKKNFGHFYSRVLIQQEHLLYESVFNEGATKS